ncbi:MAG: class I SAM-dependent methyltransferase [Nannocystales bacterium]
MKHSFDLGSVQETLLIPLLARAVETSKDNGFLEDPKAVKIVDELDYDFSKWRGHSALSGACLRTCVFDQITRRFLEAHPEGTIVEIGCGLNTRFERLDNAKAQWFELDLADSIELRRRFFDDEPRRTMLAGSVVDSDWMDAVAETGGPTLFLSEAVLIYLELEQVKTAVTQIAKRFPGAWFATDTCATKMTTDKAAQRAMKDYGIRSWFRWPCDDPKSLESWHPGIELVSSQTMPESSPDLLAKIPWSWRAMMKVAPWLVRRMTAGYRLNEFRLGSVPN